MIQRFHGVDRHKNYATISVLNGEGQEVSFVRCCTDFKGYIRGLGTEDAVVMESSAGAFFWADRIEFRSAQCYIIDPYKFKIIRDSWKKTDKQDARDMAKALWISIISKQFGLPTVYKPERRIRELRKLFSEYALIQKHIVSYKNYIQAVFTENGIVLKTDSLRKLLDPDNGKRFLELLEESISQASKIIIGVNLDLLWMVQKKKEQIKNEIYRFGNFLQDQVQLLITIKGVSPLLALAFLADVADVKRFKKQKQMNAYLGVVPGVKSSGGKTYSGHINRQSRKLARTIFTQSIHHITNSSSSFQDFYINLKTRRGAGRSRIACIRKTFGIMRRMLLDNQEYRYTNYKLYEIKLKTYHKEMEKIMGDRKIA